MDQPTVSQRLRAAVERARSRPMSDQDRAEQRRSFAYGNSAFENSRITRAMIEQAERSLKESNG